ncbi:MAG: GreA/GreB family elongation factor [Algoriphagus sp.]|nr:GreA/GreB family elongation factor [Algoriphagus sp.]
MTQIPLECKEIIERRDDISIDSPMAQALLKKEMREEAVVQTPTMQMTWRIVKIEYEK